MLTVLKAFSIRRKLLFLAMITSTSALLVTAAACMTFDVLISRETMTRNLKMNAEIIGANCSAALAFGDGADARQTLASLRGDGHIVSACVFGPDGKIFAKYSRANNGIEQFPPSALLDTAQFGSDMLEVHHVIQLDGRPVGAIYLRSDLDELYTRVKQYALILVAVLAMSSVVAFVLAARLTRLIVTPIHHLAQTARTVSDERNYSVRAVKSSNDEIGVLTAGFNEMLDQIQQRDSDLASHRAHLEEQVARRTEELQRANNQLTAAKDKAEAANEAKSNFLANMSHEIRTPMTAIIGYADVMLEPDQTISDRQDCLQVVRRNARHLVHLINDILDISKIEAEKMTVERVRTNFPQLVLDVVSLVRPRAAEKDLDMLLHFDGPTPEEILTDPTRLRQILMNLTSNSIKFTERGLVEISIKMTEKPGGSDIQIAIRDTGIGMTPEQMGRLFQPFMQADDSMTRRFGGTGLGLVISQRLARLLGGDITVNSAAGVGSTFTIHIEGGPLDDVKIIEGLTEAMLQPTPTAAEVNAPIRLIGRVLLAEDGLDNQRLISAHLRNAGAEVTIAGNGRIAVDLVRKEQFDVLVLDMQMPELDGYGAASELRRRGFTKPIIALTAHAMAEDRAKCIRAGCTDYLTKPIDKRLLLSTVSDYLVQSRKASGLDEAVQTIEPSPALTPAVSQPASPRPKAAALEQTAAGEGPLISEFLNDPDMTNVIDEFVNGLPIQVSKMQALVDGKNLRELTRVVHQLKGAGGGYGFPKITQSAVQAETLLKASDGDLTETMLERVNDLIELIRRVSGYDPKSEHRSSTPAGTA